MNRELGNELLKTVNHLLTDAKHSWEDGRDVEARNTFMKAMFVLGEASAHAGGTSAPSATKLKIDTLFKKASLLLSKAFGGDLKNY